MSLRTETVARLDGYWAARLGCSPGTLAETGVTVVPAAWETAHRVRLLFRGDATVVVAPRRLVEGLETRATALQNLDGRDLGGVTSALGVEPASVLGPQFVGYADASTLEAVDGTGVRPLGTRDARALERLRAACPTVEWSDRVGGFAIDEHAVVVGRFVDDRLVAVAAWGADDAVAGIGVIVHPAHRKAGHGSAAVAAVAATALDRGLVPEYRAHESWTASVALAEGVGFERYATYLAVATDRHPLRRPLAQS